MGDTEEARGLVKSLPNGFSRAIGPKMDIAAADEVKHLGLIANYDE